jgi:predicted negative regulator of RcsB-dependent stress response
LVLSEEWLEIFWERNRGFITLLCAFITLGIVAKYGWDYYGAAREANLQQAYAAAGTPDQLKKFVEEHPNNELTAVAELRLADQAYAAGQIAEARDGYAQVTAAIAPGPLAARARLGLGMSQIQSGQTAEGEATLRGIADDASQFQGARSEAIYQLASLAAASGQADDVQKYSAQLIQLDPNSPWTERVFALEGDLESARPPAKQAISIGQ